MTDAATDYNGKPYMLPGFTPLTEPRLLFDSEDENAVALHPLRGLAEYGPFSRNQLGVVPNPIKVATIAPSAQTGVLAKLLRELEMRHYPQERKVYVPEFLGFSKIFNVSIAHAGSSCRLELGASLDRDIATKLEPHESLLELFYSPSTFFVRAVVILTLFSFIFRSAGNERSNKEKGTILTCTIS